MPTERAKLLLFERKSGQAPPPVPPQPAKRYLFLDWGTENLRWGADEEDNLAWGED